MDPLNYRKRSAISRPEKISALLASHELAPKKIVVEEEDLEHYFFRIIQTNNRAIMKELKAALWVEMLKVRRTKIFPISIAFFIFIGIMMGLFMFLSMHPEIANRSSTISMKTSFLGGSDWKAFYDLLIQIILTVGVIGSGIITSWVFGREFSDRAIKDILALPVRRSTIVVSKMIILLVWSIILSLTVLVAALLTGLVTGIPGWILRGIFLLPETVLAVCPAQFPAYYTQWPWWPVQGGDICCPSVL